MLRFVSPRHAVYTGIGLIALFLFSLGYPQKLLSSDGFMPHGDCYMWRPGLIWLHALSDTLIASAFYFVAFTLVYFARKRSDLPFDWIFLAFAGFIVASGTARAMDIWTLWTPMYWLSGTVKAIAAGASVATAIALAKLVPFAIALPATVDLRRAKEALEARIQERTAQLQRANEELRASEERLRLAIEATNVGTWDYNPLTRQFVSCAVVNAAVGLPADAQPDYRLIFSSVHPDDRHRVSEAVRALLDPKSDGPFIVEYRTIGVHDQIERWVSARGRAFFDDSGHPVRVVGTLLDITEQKRREEVLRRLAEEREQLLEREQEARHAAEENARRSAFLSEASRILASSLDVKTTLSNVVRLAASTIGEACAIDIVRNGQIERVDVAHADSGKGELVRLFKVPTAFGADTPSAQVMRTGQPMIGEVSEELVQRTVPDEERRDAIRKLNLKSFMIVPLRTRGESLGTISLASAQPGGYTNKDLDLAQQLADRAAVAFDNARLYEEIQKSDRLKDEFLATMSHELRTPLTAIVGWSRMLKSGRLSPEKSRQAVEIIDRNAEAEAHLVEEILEASRIISGKLKLEFELVDVSDVLASAVQCLSPFADGKGIEVATQFHPVPPVWANPQRLQQVFWNLLSNSVKFTPSGGKILVSLRGTASLVQVRVTDTGIGISPDFIPHVFERFRQADASFARRHGGLGLGLAIVRHIVELHGGTVLAESPGAGLGATFTVNIPFAEQQEREIRPRLITKGVLESSLEGMRILVVEDDEDARELVREVLEHYGGDVAAADSYAAAMAYLETTRPGPDVVLIDIGMPEHDGYAVIAKMRSMPALSQTPAIAVTAFATESDRSMAIAAGFQAHLPKPFDPVELVSQVLNVTGHPPRQDLSA